MAGLLSDEEEETAKKPPIMESKPASKSPSIAASQGRRGLLMVPGWAESWPGRAGSRTREENV